MCFRYEDPDEDPDEVLIETGLSRSAACEWAIFGHTVQDELNFEDDLNRLADYVERLRDYSDLLKKTLDNVLKAD